MVSDLLNIMAKTITIELPEEVSMLIERNEILRQLVESVAKESIKDFLVKFLSLYRILSETGLTEEEVMEIDKEVKGGLWSKVKRDWNL